jgi:hypothetical protein
MSESLSDSVTFLIKSLDIASALNVLHYVGRLVKHKSGHPSITSRREFWAPGIHGEPSKEERTLGQELLHFLEDKFSKDVVHWSDEVASKVTDALSESAAALSKHKWGESSANVADDYLQCWSGLPIKGDAPAELAAILESKELLEEIGDIAKSSSPEDYLLLKLRMEGMTWDEVAKELGKDPKRLRYHWYRMLYQIRHRLMHPEGKR